MYSTDMTIAYGIDFGSVDPLRLALDENFSTLYEREGFESLVEEMFEERVRIGEYLALLEKFHEVGPAEFVQESEAFENEAPVVYMPYGPSESPHWFLAVKDSITSLNGANSYDGWQLNFDDTEIEPERLAEISDYCSLFDIPSFDFAEARWYSLLSINN